MVNLMLDGFDQHKHGPVFKSSLKDLPDYTNFIMQPMCLDELRRAVRDRVPFFIAKSKTRDIDVACQENTITCRISEGLVHYAPKCRDV